MLKDVHWLGHAGIKITGERVVYVDPYKIKGGEKAHLILITHDHYDHLSAEDIDKIRGRETIVVVPVGAADKLAGPVETIKPGETLTLAGVEVTAVAAYNVEKKFHPRSKQHVGYLFTVGGVTYYHAGDTDVIPEMTGIKADVAFLPVGGTYTMDVQAAVRAVERIKPKVAVPIHWGTIVGSQEDAQAFKKQAGCEVQILSVEE